MLLGFLARGDPDVDVHRMEVGDFFSVIRFLKMDGKKPRDSGNGTPDPMDRDALTPDQGVVNPPDPLDREVSVVRDMGDYETKLIDMAADEHRRVPLRIKCRVGVPVGINLDRVGEAGDVVYP